MKTKDLFFNLFTLNMIVFFLNDYLHIFTISARTNYLFPFILSIAIAPAFIAYVRHFFLLKDNFLINILLLTGLLSFIFIVSDIILPTFYLQNTMLFNYNVSKYFSALVFNFFVSFYFYLIYELR